jgi:hypothetical protein
VPIGFKVRDRCCPSRLISKGDDWHTGEAPEDVLAQSVDEAIPIDGSVYEDHCCAVCLGVEEGIGTVSACSTVMPVVAGMGFEHPGRTNLHLTGVGT